MIKTKIKSAIYKILNATIGRYYGLLPNKATYNFDGLTTFHVSHFRQDPLFIESYAKGKSTGAWPAIDIYWRAYIACWVANKVKNLEGDFVECGVYRGGLARTIIHYIQFEKLNKKFYLFDTYGPIPTQHVHEKEFELNNPNNWSYSDVYETVVKTFSPFKNVIVKRGVIPEILHTEPIEKVCYLSIDLNNFQPEIAAIEYYWDKLVEGGIVLLDDYALSEKYVMQSNAWDKFAESKGIKILNIPTGQGLIFK